MAAAGRQISFLLEKFGSLNPVLEAEVISVFSSGMRYSNQHGILT